MRLSDADLSLILKARTMNYSQTEPNKHKQHALIRSTKYTHIN